MTRAILPILACLVLVSGMWMIAALYPGRACVACTCKVGATCQGKCSRPCACRPAKPAEVATMAIDAVPVTRCGYAQPVPEPKLLLLGFKQRINPICVKMKRELDKRPDVKQAINAKYDVRIYDWVKDKDQCEKYAVNDVPTCIVIGLDGKECRRFVGYKSPNELLRWLELPCPH